MARPSKSKLRSRSNGAKASNAGKLTSRQDKQERYLPGCGPEKPAGFDCARARVILNAYEEAVGAAE